MSARVPVALALLMVAPVALAGVAGASHLPYAALLLGGDVHAVLFAFAPAVMAAAPGDNVTFWGYGHTATFFAFAGAGPAPAPFDLRVNGVTGWEVPEGTPPGVVVYVCKYHTTYGMAGAIVIA